jgi:hypothetical protein
MLTETTRYEDGTEIKVHAWTPKDKPEQLEFNIEVPNGISVVLGCVKGDPAPECFAAFIWHYYDKPKPDEQMARVIERITGQKVAKAFFSGGNGHGVMYVTYGEPKEEEPKPPPPPGSTWEVNPTPESLAFVRNARRYLAEHAGTMTPEVTAALVADMGKVRQGKIVFSEDQDIAAYVARLGKEGTP